jgi:precorrin-2 dehydrogenase / sirohydrochlorin ferrochelatase
MSLQLGDAPHSAAQVIPYYPVALDLRDRLCLVVGGGPVAEAKVEGLLAAGARVTVVSPEITEALTTWAIEGSIIHRPHRYRPEDLDGQQLVFSASDQREVTEAVSAEARRRGLWVNAADDPVFCDFLLPSVLRRGRLVVAVSTGGASPALAARVRRDLEAYFAPAYGELVELAAEVRAELRSRAHRPGGVAWREAFDGELIELLAEGRRAEAKARLLDRLGAAV